MLSRYASKVPLIQVHDNQLQIFGGIVEDSSPRYGLNGNSAFALRNFCTGGLWRHGAQILQRKVNEMKSTERFADLPASFTKERQRKNSTKREYKVKFRPRVRDSQGEALVAKAGSYTLEDKRERSQLILKLFS